MRGRCGASRCLPPLEADESAERASKRELGEHRGGRREGGGENRGPGGDERECVAGGGCRYRRDEDTDEADDEQGHSVANGSGGGDTSEVFGRGGGVVEAVPEKAIDASRPGFPLIPFGLYLVGQFLGHFG